jgi:hypothetical protein
VSKKVAVIIRDKERQYEGLRSSLGLLLEDHIVSMFVLDHEIDMTDEYRDNMEFIDEMGGGRYSNIRENCEKYGFNYLSIEEIGERLREADLIIPF